MFKDILALIAIPIAIVFVRWLLAEPRFGNKL